MSSIITIRTVGSLFPYCSHAHFENKYFPRMWGFLVYGYLLLPTENGHRNTSENPQKRSDRTCDRTSVGHIALLWVISESCHLGTHAISDFFFFVNSAARCGRWYAESGAEGGRPLGGRLLGDGVVRDAWSVGR